MSFQTIYKYQVKSTVLWDVTPCSLVEVHKYLGQPYCLHLQGCKVSQAITFAYMLLAGCLVYSLTLNMEATLYSETSVNLRYTTWLHMPEDNCYPH